MTIDVPVPVPEAAPGFDVTAPVPAAVPGFDGALGQHGTDAPAPAVAPAAPAHAAAPADAAAAAAPAAAAADAIEIHETAPAKVNLTLLVSPEVRGGRHRLSSVFTALELADSLHVTYDPAGPERLDFSLCSAAGLPELDIPPEENIVLQALRRFEEKRGGRFMGSLTVHLTKAIPAAAGLGGGSSDAAAMIRALARLDGLSPDAAICRQTAAAVGSDVSFFLAGGCALVGAEGQQIAEHFELSPLDVLLVKPAVGISTAQVYQRFDRELEAAQGGQASQAAQGGQAASAVGAGQATPTDQATPAAPATPPDQPAPAGNGLAGLLRGTPASTAQEVAQFMENNLEPAALALCPECRTIIEQLKAQDGVLKAMVSGSGSTVFALCESQAAALAAARWFAQPGQPGHWTCVTRTTPASET